MYELKRKDRVDYEAVIAHIGVVDFSPRPASTIQNIISLKEKKIQEVFGSAFLQQMKDLKIYADNYMGEKTSSILPEELIPKVVDEFNKIPNLIWISCNPVDLSWNGNYKRKRPDNINMVNSKSKRFLKLLNPDVLTVDLTDLTEDEVHLYTCDNIHLSEQGMNMIETKLKHYLEK